MTLVARGNVNLGRLAKTTAQLQKNSILDYFINSANAGVPDPDLSGTCLTLMIND
jgi:hypothetical protein